MNWKEISGKYPKAFDKLSIWFQRHGMDYDRELYDFFDEQGIFVTINIFQYDTFENHVLWDYKILSGMTRQYDLDYDTRQEAEEAAFTKAFEILEEKLNKK